MTMLLTAFIMIAFAGIYAVLLAMLGNSASAIIAALTGRSPQAAGGSKLAASRCLTRA